jgi:hypothetical protein
MKTATIFFLLILVLSCNKNIKHVTSTTIRQNINIMNTQDLDTSNSIEIEKLNFFGIKMEYKYDEIVEVLRRENIVYKEEKVDDLPRYVTIMPKDQFYGEFDNWDFNISLLDENIVLYSKHNISNKYLSELSTILGNNFEKEQHGKFIEYKWFNSIYEIVFSVDTKNTNQDSNCALVIRNLENVKQSNDYKDSIRGTEGL